MRLGQVQRVHEQGLQSQTMVQNFKLWACPLTPPHPHSGKQRLEMDMAITMVLLVSAQQIRSSWILVFKWNIKTLQGLLYHFRGQTSAPPCVYFWLTCWWAQTDRPVLGGTPWEAEPGGHSPARCSSSGLGWAGHSWAKRLLPRTPPPPHPPVWGRGWASTMTQTIFIQDFNAVADPGGGAGSAAAPPSFSPVFFFFFFFFNTHLVWVPRPQKKLFMVFVFKYHNVILFFYLLRGHQTIFFRLPAGRSLSITGRPMSGWSSAFKGRAFTAPHVARWPARPGRMRTRKLARRDKQSKSPRSQFTSVTTLTCMQWQQCMPESSHGKFKKSEINPHVLKVKPLPRCLEQR